MKPRRPVYCVDSITQPATSQFWLSVCVPRDVSGWQDSFWPVRSGVVNTIHGQQIPAPLRGEVDDIDCERAFRIQWRHLDYAAFTVGILARVVGTGNARAIDGAGPQGTQQKRTPCYDSSDLSKKDSLQRTVVEPSGSCMSWHELL